MTRLLILLSIAILCTCSCADQTTDKSNTAGAKVDSTTAAPTVVSFNDLDIKPRFGGCKDVKDPVELKTCSDKKMSKFISNNLQYPENARKLKIQGKAVVSFVIEPNGSLSDITAVSNIGGGLEEEAIRVFQLMNEKKMWWVAGMKDGKYQRVQLQMPINFKL